MKILVRWCRKFIELVSLEVRVCEDFKGIRVFLVLVIIKIGRFLIEFNRVDVFWGERIILYDNLFILLSVLF